MIELLALIIPPVAVVSYFIGYRRGLNKGADEMFKIAVKSQLEHHDKVMQEIGYRGP